MLVKILEDFTLVKFLVVQYSLVYSKMGSWLNVANNHIS